MRGAASAGILCGMSRSARLVPAEGKVFADPLTGVRVSERLGKTVVLCAAGDCPDSPTQVHPHPAFAGEGT